MNDSDYPRKVKPLHFDLLNHYYRKGDRSRREDDRYLFLEALVSARSKLVLSYRYRSLRDNSELTPSVLLSELMDYCKKGFYRTSQAPYPSEHRAECMLKSLYQDHALQPFNPKYFKLGSSFQSFQSEWCFFDEIQNQSLLKAWQCDSAFTHQGAEVTLETLSQAFKHLPKFFMKERFGVQWRPPADVPAEVEPFALDSLKAWQLRQALLQKRIQQGDEQRLFQEWQITGLIPQGALGELQIEQVSREIEGLWKRLEPNLKQQEPTQQEINLTLSNGVCIQGWLPNVYDNRLIEIYPGKDYRRSFFQWGLRHMLRSASGQYAPEFSYWFGLEQSWQLKAIKPAEAKAYVELCFETFQTALERPLPFLDALSFEFVDPAVQKTEQRQKKACAAFQQRRQQPSELYLSALYDEDNGYWLEEAGILAERLYQPLLDLREAADESA